MNTLKDLYDVINDRMLGSELNGIGDVIDYIEEGQAIVFQMFPIQCAPVESTLSDVDILAVPASFRGYHRLTINDLDVVPSGFWNGELLLPYKYTGTAKLWYTKNPSALSEASPETQTLEIDKRYWNALANYVASCYFVTDDDPVQREAHRIKFRETLGLLGAITQTARNFTNIW